MTLRWALMGAGSIAAAFVRDLNFLRENQGIDQEVVAVASSERSRAIEFADRFQIPQALHGIDELTKLPSIDVVYLANVQSLHHQSAKRILEAEIPLLCEKPFTLNALQAEELISIARNKKVFLMEAMWTRFLPHIGFLLELIHNDEIGEVLAVEADHGQWVYRKKDHRLLKPELGGGALLDLGVYPISLVHLLLGKPTKIQATAKMEASGVDESVGALFRYESGAIATIHTTLATVTATRAVISGSKGRIEIDRSFYAPSSLTLIPHQGEVRRFSNPLTDPGYLGLGEQTKEVKRCIENNLIESSMRPLQSTLEVMEIMDQIREIIGLRYPGEISDANNPRFVS
jgi:predicted dehydrogenase